MRTVYGIYEFVRIDGIDTMLDTIYQSREDAVEAINRRCYDIFKDSAVRDFAELRWSGDSLIADDEYTTYAKWTIIPLKLKVKY